MREKQEKTIFSLREKQERLTGKRVKEIREALDLNIHAFSELMGVAVSSIYRWEADSAPTPDPMQRRLLLALDVWLRGKPKAQELGDKIKSALVVEGSLQALYVLVEVIK